MCITLKAIEWRYWIIITSLLYTSSNSCQLDATLDEATPLCMSNFDASIAVCIFKRAYTKINPILTRIQDYCRQR